MMMYCCPRLGLPSITFLSGCIPPKILTRNHTLPPACVLCVLRFSSAFEVASSI
jgi:hypothetical protein